MWCKPKPERPYLREVIFMFDIFCVTFSHLAEKFGFEISEVESECFPEATITLLVLRDGDGTHEENSVDHQHQNFLKTIIIQQKHKSKYKNKHKLKLRDGDGKHEENSIEHQYQPQNFFEIIIIKHRYKQKYTYKLK